MSVGATLRHLSGAVVATQEQLSAREARRGIRMVVLDGVCSMAMATLLGGPFLTAFALALGATNYDIGVLAAIAFFAQLMQVPGLYLVHAVRRRRAIAVVTATTARLLWLLIVLIPALFPQAGVTFLLHWLLLSALIGAIPGPAWNSLVRDIVPPEALGRVFARRMILGNAVALGLTLGGGIFVDWWSVTFPATALYAYSLIFLVAILIGLVGVGALRRLPEPAMTVEEGLPLLELLRRPVRDANFRRLLVFIGTWSFAINMAIPFFAIYMLRQIGLSLALVTKLLVVSQLTHLLFLRIWGRLADRHSNTSVLKVSGPLLLLAILGWSFTTMPERYALTIPLLILIHVLSGMSLAGVVLASGNIALKLSPRGAAHAYVTAFGLVGAATGAVAPLVGGALADFFAYRELAVSLTWAEPARQFSVYAWHARALDFVFLIAFVIGVYSLTRLARVREDGEVAERAILEEIVDEVVLPFRTISSVEGFRRLTFLPLWAMQRIRRGLGPPA